MVGRITYSYSGSVTRINPAYSVSSTSSSFYRCHGQKQSNIKMIHVFKLYFFLSIFYNFVIFFFNPYERCLYWSKEIEPQRWNESAIGAFTYGNNLEYLNGTLASARYISGMRRAERWQQCYRPEIRSKGIVKPFEWPWVALVEVARFIPSSFRIQDRTWYHPIFILHKILFGWPNNWATEERWVNSF